MLKVMWDFSKSFQLFWMMPSSHQKVKKLGKSEFLEENLCTFVVTAVHGDGLAQLGAHALQVVKTKLSCYSVLYITLWFRRGNPDLSLALLSRTYNRLLGRLSQSTVSDTWHSTMQRQPGKLPINTFLLPWLARDSPRPPGTKLLKCIFIR